MKLLIVFALLCVMIPLIITAEEGGESGEEDKTSEEHLLEKRSLRDRRQSSHYLSKRQYGGNINIGGHQFGGTGNMGGHQSGGGYSWGERQSSDYLSKRQYGGNVNIGGHQIGGTGNKGGHQSGGGYNWGRNQVYE